MFDEFADPITTTASRADGDGPQGGLTVGGREAEVAAIGHPDVGELLFGVFTQVLPFVEAQGGLAQQGERAFAAAQGVDVAGRLADLGATAMVPTASSCPSWPT